MQISAGMIQKNNKNLNPYENSKDISFGISLESKKFYLDHQNFGMQISAKICKNLGCI